MKQYRVLLIDDEEELVSTLVERLELRGIEAEAVTRGQAALDLLEKKRFDVVVADLKMPGMSGLEVMRTIRETYPDTKVLMITGHGAEDDETAEVREGEFEVLMKPFPIDVLLARIRGVLGEPEGDGE